MENKCSTLCSLEEGWDSDRDKETYNRLRVRYPDLWGVSAVQSSEFSFGCLAIPDHHFQTDKKLPKSLKCKEETQGPSMGHYSASRAMRMVLLSVLLKLSDICSELCTHLPNACLLHFLIEASCRSFPWIVITASRMLQFNTTED